MKVLYICPTSRMYGDNVALLNLLPYLCKQGVDPVIYTSHEGDFSNKLKELGYPYITGYDVLCPGVWPSFVNLRVTFGLIRRVLLGVYRKEYKKLLATVKTIAPDLIHCNLSTTTLGLQLAKDLGIPHVWHVREYGSLDHGYHQFPSKHGLQRKFNDSNTRTIFITEGIREFYNRPRNSVAIYDGVIDPQRVSTLSIAKEKYFLYVGRLVETKGLHSVFPSFSVFCKSHPDYVLKIAGEGGEKYMETLHNMVHKYDLENNVEFMGYQKDVYPYMQKATAIIVPSRFEAMGFITSEALYNGCPVIGRNTAGTKEQMDNVSDLNARDAKVVYPYNNDEELLNSMLEVVQTSLDITLLQELHDKVVELYNAEKSASSVYGVYLKAMNK